MERVVFYLIAAMMVFFALKAVTSRRMLRSVIYLLFVLVGIAGLYFMIDYTFMAAIQLAVYAGGVIVLIILKMRYHNSKIYKGTDQTADRLKELRERGVIEGGKNLSRCFLARWMA